MYILKIVYVTAIKQFHIWLMAHYRAKYYIVSQISCTIDRQYNKNIQSVNNNISHNYTSTVQLTKTHSSNIS